MNSNNKKGFTLVELLVVIAIIGLLSSMAIVLVNFARAKARDAKRKADLKQFQTALDLFYDEYNMYPCGDTDDSVNPAFNGTLDGSRSCPSFLNGGTPINCNNGLTIGLFDEGLLNTDCPKDPINDRVGNKELIYGYYVTGDQQIYMLVTYLELDNEAMSNDNGKCNDVYEIGPGTGILAPHDNVGLPGCL